MHYRLIEVYGALISPQKVQVYGSINCIHGTTVPSLYTFQDSRIVEAFNFYDLVWPLSFNTNFSIVSQ